MTRFVLQTRDAGKPLLDGDVGDVKPLEDTGLFVVEALDPRQIVEVSDGIAWAAPTLGEEDQESYPTGEVSVRFMPGKAPADLASFAKKNAVEVRRRNEFIPEQIVVAPSEPHRTWLPDLVERLSGEGVVDKAWPNTLSRYRRR